MGVALAVLVIGMGIVVGLVEYVLDERLFGKGSPEDGGPIGLLVGLGAAAIASGIVSWRVTRRLAAPLEEIGDATRRLAEGRYDVRLPGSDTDELDALASDVNRLAAELESTEQRRLRLIGDVAHELRNPLSTIEGTMEALLDGVVEADDETFARLGREAARLRRLADDLSSLSAAGELGDLDTAPVDLAVVGRHVVDQLEPQAAAKGLTMTLDTTDSCVVSGDADRLTQALMNVVGNAVQYTDAGSITVLVGREADHAVIDVIDTGRGLSASDQAQVFERFYRVDEHFADGTGVGLAIVRLVVEAHGGRVSAASSGLGSGSTFRIALPSATAATESIGNQASDSP